MIVFLTAAMHGVIMGWLVDRLNADKYLTPADIDSLKTAFAEAGKASVHILVQTLNIRTSDWHRDIYVNPIIVQRNTASNLQDGLNRACASVNSDKILQLAKSMLVLLAYAMDNASSNERIQKEELLRYRHCPTILVFCFYCSGHVCGNTLSEGIVLTKAVDAMCCLSKILTYMEHRDPFLARLAVVVPNVVRVVRVDVLPSRQASADFIQ